MDAINYLYYGLGQVAYAVALSDGKVQREETEKLHELVTEGLSGIRSDLNVSEIIFKMLDHDHVFNTEDSYQNGIKNMNLGGNHLTDEMRKTFVSVIENIADAFPPKVKPEMDNLDRFKSDILEVH